MQHAAPVQSALFADRARTFAFAARLLPAEQYEATVRLYAFFRNLDDLMDEDIEALTPVERVERLAAWDGWFRGAAAPAGMESMATSLQSVMERYSIPTWIFEEFLEGMAMDVGQVRVASFEELYRYCFRAAGTVGLAMTHVLGATSPAALWAANMLGVGMQLTNVLRDIGSDLARYRLYLHAEELARFGYTAEQLFDHWRARTPPDERFRALLRFQVERAHAYYARGLAGVWLLPPGPRLAILVAGRLYRAILDCIERDGYIVLNRRAATSRWHKLREAAACVPILWWRRYFPGSERVGADWQAAPELAWSRLSLADDTPPRRTGSLPSQTAPAVWPQSTIVTPPPREVNS